MPASTDDQVLDFYGNLFDQLFSEPFRSTIPERRRLNVVIRQVQDAADASSSSLTRFFQNQKLSEQTVEGILAGFAAIGDSLALGNISNSNVTTEEIVENLLNVLPCPKTVQQTHDAVYRLALHTVVQVLMQVGPVMAEWQKLNFSSTFELPRRVVNRLNEISEQINALGQSGQFGADERYELQYRDYLLQRFHKVEAGTVRMTTSLDVDLRELFVMPRVVKRKNVQDEELIEVDASVQLMDLTAARQLYGAQKGSDRFFLVGEQQDNETTEEQFDTALEQVKCSPRMVMVGLPGSGKSTFFEWLQVKLASLEEQFILGDQQAIPLMLRVRQLDLRNMPTGAALIEKATASKDRADLMPRGWIDRQMKAGRILLMLDGLDETEPELLKQKLLPWLFGLLKKYPKCHYLISSRPVGYSPRLLFTKKFTECDLLDFNRIQIDEYTRHWCTAVRLARNETEVEARHEGALDGEHIVEGFQEHPYIRDLARNPLMLSAICLVNYFEGGRLPEDRALLYQLCVEGLLHNWDRRRGIHSEFSFDEKLRACREVALAMQKEDLAECEADRVKEIFTMVLNDSERAYQLLEHIRYRTGLLLERRPSVFGFAHLTFQEYLAARAIHEGNRLGVDTNQLVKEHDDGRWKEVIALYCGLATTPAVRNFIEQLIGQSDTASLGEALTEAYFSSGSECEQDRGIRRRVLERVAVIPNYTLRGEMSSELLYRFPIDDVVFVANTIVGLSNSEYAFSGACTWLSQNPEKIEIETLQQRLLSKCDISPIQTGELVFLLALAKPSKELFDILQELDLKVSLKLRIFQTPGFGCSNSHPFLCSLAEIILICLSLCNSWEKQILPKITPILKMAAQILQKEDYGNFVTFSAIKNIIKNQLAQIPDSWETLEKQEFSSSFRLLAKKIADKKIADKNTIPDSLRSECIDSFVAWADLLDGISS
jgi:NACHT domain